MKTLAILSLGIAVALGMSPFAPDVAQNPVLTEEEQSPLLGDVVPMQGHVMVEDPAPQVRPGSREQQEKLAPETDQSPHVQVNKDSVMELEVKVKPEEKVDPELKAEQEVKTVRDVKVDPEAKADTEVHLNPEVMAELEVKVKSEVKMESELNVRPDVKVESEVKVEPDVQWEPEVKPMFSNEQEVQEEMFLEEETETSLDVEERHIDIMELEPLDDDNMFGQELSNMELSEEEGIMGRSNDVLDGEPIMELEPETKDMPFLHQQVMPGSAIMEEGPALDIMGQEIPPLGGYFPNEEAMMGMEGVENEVFREEESPMVEEPVLEDSPLPDGGVQIGVVPEREKRALMQQGVQTPVEQNLLPKEQFSCPGVVLERKCYQFFKGPKRATDAEFFCQEHFPGGHLASITSQYIHRQVMNMMLQQNGAYTRTWIGGLRYLKTGRFIWLDGSYWGYADWLSGEPNNPADVEDCLEVLAHGNGKFNDFTCWEPQAFICSYPYE